MQSTTVNWLLLLLVRMLVALPPVVGTKQTDWPELELKHQPNKLAYCRALHRLQLQQYEETSCQHILEDELSMTGELLMDSLQRCWPGWELFGRRCHKRA